MDPGWSGQHFGNDGVVNVNSRLGKINIKMNKEKQYDKALLIQLPK